MTPVAESRDSPEGRLPIVMVQPYGGMPPVAVNVAEYGEPVVASGSEPVVIVKTNAACTGRLKNTGIAVKSSRKTIATKWTRNLKMGFDLNAVTYPVLPLIVSTSTIHSLTTTSIYAYVFDPVYSQFSKYN